LHQPQLALAELKTWEKLMSEDHKSKMPKDSKIHRDIEANTSVSEGEGDTSKNACSHLTFQPQDTIDGQEILAVNTSALKIDANGVGPTSLKVVIG
jgi:hypothetical protein